MLCAVVTENCLYGKELDTHNRDLFDVHALVAQQCVIIGIHMHALHRRFSQVANACSNYSSDGVFSFLIANLSGKVRDFILSGKWLPCPRHIIYQVTF